MSTDKDARRKEIKAGGLGLAAGGLTAGIDALPFHDAAALATIGEVTAIGYTTSALLVAGAIAHNRWWHMPHKRLQRELGEGGWLNRYDLKESAGAPAMPAAARIAAAATSSATPAGVHRRSSSGRPACMRPAMFSTA